MRILYCWLLVSLCSPQSLFSQEAGNILYHQSPRPTEPIPSPAPTPEAYGSPYLFTVNALYNVPADAYVAVFNLVQLAPSAWEADSLLQLRLQGLSASLQQLGIPDTAIYTDMITQVPIYAYEVEKKLFSKRYLEVPKGIELQKNLHIHYRDGRLLNRIMAAAARQEIYDLVKVDYFIENLDQHFQTLREKALAYHLNEVETYAQLQVSLDTCHRVFTHKQSVHMPVSRYQRYQASSRASIKGLKNDKGLTQVRQPSSLYYQAISPDQFELIVNPVVRQPVVQLVFNLRIRYEHKPPKKQLPPKTEIKREKEFILLTPDGKVQPLSLTVKPIP